MLKNDYVSKGIRKEIDMALSTNINANVALELAQGQSEQDGKHQKNTKD